MVLKRPKKRLQLRSLLKRLGACSIPEGLKRYARLTNYAAIWRVASQYEREWIARQCDAGDRKPCPCGIVSCELGEVDFTKATYKQVLAQLRRLGYCP